MICQEQTGFLVKQPCDKSSIGTCTGCGKHLCEDHAVPLGGGEIPREGPIPPDLKLACPDCYETRFREEEERRAATRAPGGTSETTTGRAYRGYRGYDDDRGGYFWPYFYYSRYYRDTGYRPSRLDEDFDEEDRAAFSKEAAGESLGEGFAEGQDSQAMGDFEGDFEGS